MPPFTYLKIVLSPFCKIPVTYYSQLMTVAYGGSAKEAGLDGNVVRATKLEEIAAKK